MEKNEIESSIQSLVEKDQKVKLKIWMGALFCLSIAILGYGLLFSHNDTNNVPYLTGYNMTMTAIFFFMLHKFYGKEAAGKHSWTAFPIILACLVVGDLIAYEKNTAQAKLAMSEVKSEYESMIKTASQAPAINSVEKRSVPTIKSSGDAGQMEGFMKSYLSDFGAILVDYQKELVALGWDQILKTEYIQADDHFLKSKAMIEKARIIVATYRQKYIDMQASGKSRIMALDMPYEKRVSMLAGFEKGMTNSRKEIDGMWDYEAKTIDEFANIITLLDTRKGAWVIDKGQLLFSEQKDLDALNASMLRIQEYTTKQAELQNANKDRTMKKLNEAAGDL